ncbi:hypothetical protein DMA11_11740 [Marinilabiliaceae bacterium JC017]|nr:hypothetical protein DMA11_11740 [Marinilabiliaceae bacterium JC017]
MKRKTKITGLTFIVLCGLFLAGWLLKIPTPGKGPLTAISLPGDIADSSQLHYIEQPDGSRQYYRVIQPENKDSIRAILLFIHSVSVHSGWYTDLARQIAQNGTLILLPDIGGHGVFASQTELPDNMHTVLKGFSSVLNSAKEKYPHLPTFAGGISMGGELAINFGLSYPNTVDGLLLISPFIAGSNNYDTQACFGRGGMYSFCFSRFIFPDIESIYVNFPKTLKDPYLRCNYPLSFFNIYKNKDYENPFHRLSQVRLPVLWLHATKEQIILKDESRQLFESIASHHKEFMEIEQADHLNICTHVKNPINSWIEKTQFLIASKQ